MVSYVQTKNEILNQREEIFNHCTVVDDKHKTSILNTIDGLIEQSVNEANQIYKSICGDGVLDIKNMTYNMKLRVLYTACKFGAYDIITKVLSEIIESDDIYTIVYNCTDIIMEHNDELFLYKFIDYLLINQFDMMYNAKIIFEKYKLVDLLIHVVLFAKYKPKSFEDLLNYCELNRLYELLEFYKERGDLLICKSLFTCIDKRKTN